MNRTIPESLRIFRDCFFTGEATFIFYKMGCFTLANRRAIRYYKNKRTPCGKKGDKKERFIYGGEKSGIKKFLEEFKAFAMRGNVLDMAVGVVIGGAFTAIVTALVEDIINPLIGLFFKADFSDVVIGLGGSSIKIGEFVNSIINFLIVAFVLFVVIKFVNSLHKKPEEPAAPEEPTTKVCPYCQSEISIKAVRCPHCTSKLEGFPEMKA